MPFEPSTGPAEGEGVAGDAEAEGISTAGDEADGEAPPTTIGTVADGLEEADETPAAELEDAEVPAAELEEGAGPPTMTEELEALADEAEAAADEATGLETEALDELATDEALLALAEVTTGLVDVGTGVTGLAVVVVAALVLVTGAAEVHGLLQPFEYLEVALGPLTVVLAPNLLTSEDTCLQFIEGGGFKPYVSRYQFWTYSLLKPPPHCHSLSFQADQSKSVHWAQEAETLLVALVVGTDLTLETEEGAATAELALTLDEAAADDLTADDEVTADCLAIEETTEEAVDVLAGATLVDVVVGWLQPQPMPKTQKNRLSSDFSASMATGAAEERPARPR